MQQEPEELAKEQHPSTVCSLQPSTARLETTGSVQLATLSLDALAERCQEETDKFLRRESYDPQFCFELLRRALAEDMAEAFTCVYHLYEKQVLGWVYSHNRFLHTGESGHYFASEAWRTFYFALRGPKFDQFPALPQVMAYLKLCVHSAIAQYLRNQHQLPATTLDDAIAIGVYQDLAAGTAAADLWSRICQLLPDDRDQLLARCVFLQQLKPLEIAQHYHTHWHDAREVTLALYRIRRLLRNDPELLAQAGIAPDDAQLVEKREAHQRKPAAIQP